MAKVDNALESVLEGYASFLRERIEARGPVAALKFLQHQVTIIRLLDTNSPACLLPQDHRPRRSKTWSSFLTLHAERASISVQPKRDC